MKVCHVIFSTNRLEYLNITLESQKQNLDFSGVNVHKIFIDDFPKNRDDNLITLIAKSYGFDEIVLHQENMGITATWQHFFDIVKDRDYDYIFHQEDDVKILYPIKILDLIDMLKDDPRLCQIQLRRNNWYDCENEPIGPRRFDYVTDKYRYELQGRLCFWILASLYPAWIAKEPILKETGSNPSELGMGTWMKDQHGLTSALLKTSEGWYMAEHFGEYFQGKRNLPGEIAWDQFKHMDPNKKYCSRTGRELED